MEQTQEKPHDRIKENYRNFGEENRFVCPTCGHSWKEDPSNHDYDERPTIYCPECETELTANAESSMWYVQYEDDFGIQYLKSRGLTNLPEGAQWHSLAYYVHRFLMNDRKESEKLSDIPNFKVSFAIVTEYFDKPVVDEK